MAKRFTSILVQDGVVSPAKMQEALERQSLYGGRIGTNLLELGLIDELLLLQYLSRAKILPSAMAHHYADLDPDALKLLDIESVERMRILPVRLHANGYADALVEDPLSARLIAELKDLTGFTFSPFIVPEFRFVQVLHEMFGRRLSERYGRLIQRYPQELRLGEASGLRVEEVEAAPEREAVELARPKGVHSASDYRRDRQLGFGWAQADVIVFLRDLYCRNTTLELLLGYTGNFVLRRTLWVVGRDRLQGFSAAGIGGTLESVRSARHPIADGTLLDELRQARTYFKGHPVEIGIEGLYGQLGASLPPHCVMMPIAVGPRAGLILLLDDERRKVDVDSLAPLFIVINEVSTTLERIIMLTKRGELPPEELRVPPIPVRYRHHQNVGKPRTSPVPSSEPAPARVIRVQDPTRSVLTTRTLSEEDPNVELELASSSDMLRASFGRRTAKALEERRSEEEASLAAAPVSPRPARGEVRRAGEASAPAPAEVARVEVPVRFGEDADEDEQVAFRATDALEGMGSLDLGWDLPDAFEPTAEIPIQRGVDLSAPSMRAPDSREAVEARVRAVRDARLEAPHTTEQRPAAWQLTQSTETVREAIETEAQRAPMRADTTELRRVGEIRNLLTLLDFDAFRTHERLVFKNVVGLVDGLHRALESRSLAMANQLADELLIELHHAGIPLPVELADRLARSGLLERPPAPRQTGNLHRVLRDGESEGESEGEVESEDSDVATLQLGAIDRRTGESRIPYARSDQGRQFVSMEAAREDSDGPQLARPAVTMSRPIEINPGPRGEAEATPVVPEPALLESAEPEMAVAPVEDADLAMEEPMLGEPAHDEAPMVDVMAIELEALGDEDDGEGEVEGVRADPSAPLVNAALVELEPIGEEAEEVPALDPETLSALTYYRPLVAAFCADGDAWSRAALVESQGRALPAILERFPGPLVLDRYSFTVANLPRVEEHGPLLRVLVELGDLAAPALVAMLSAASADVRFYATFFFASVHYDPALPELGDRLFDRDGPIREVVRGLLRRYRSSASWPRLLETLRGELGSGDGWHVEQAVLALMAFADVGAVPSLIGLLERDNRRVADAAHRALCTICLDDQGTSARRWERWLESHRGGDRNAWLVEALNHSSADIRELAAAELTAIPGLLVNYSPQASRAQRRQAQQIVAQHLRVS